VVGHQFGTGDVASVHAREAVNGGQEPDLFGGLRGVGRFRWGTWDVWGLSRLSTGGTRPRSGATPRRSVAEGAGGSCEQAGQPAPGGPDAWVIFGR
jgi:hypothetical protein